MGYEFEEYMWDTPNDKIIRYYRNASTESQSSFERLFASYKANMEKAHKAYFRKDDVDALAKWLAAQKASNRKVDEVAHALMNMDIDSGRVDDVMDAFESMDIDGDGLADATDALGNMDLDG